MSLLQQLNQLCSSDVMMQVSDYYGNYFPMELRQALSDWMEERLL